MHADYWSWYVCLWRCDGELVFKGVVFLGSPSSFSFFLRGEGGAWAEIYVGVHAKVCLLEFLHLGRRRKGEPFELVKAGRD